MRIGTAHFIDEWHAVRYYRDYYDNPQKAVREKVAAGEILYGAPKAPRGTHSAIDSDGRYWLVQDYAGRLK